jgi:Flp pilus assembly protein TadG
MMKHPSQQRGQGLVEFAVIFPLFAFLMFAVIDGGLLMGRYNQTNHAASVGARLGSVQQGSASAAVDAVVADAAVHGAGSAADYVHSCNFGGGGPDAAVCVQWLAGPNGEAPGDVGSQIRVAVKYKYTLITPLVNQIADWNITSCSVERQEQPLTNLSADMIGSGTSCTGAGVPTGTPTTPPTHTPTPTRTPTNTPVPTNTPHPPTATNTPHPPTPTRTPTPNRTATSIAATATERAERTQTSVAKTATAAAPTNTPVPTPTPTCFWFLGFWVCF